MEFSKKGEFKVESNNHRVEYLSQISGELISLKQDQVKIMPGIVGGGHAIAWRTDSSITIIAEYSNHREKTLTTCMLEIKKDGVYYNGRKL